MQSILEELNKNPGVKGSMVVTGDGLMIAQDLGPTLDEQTVSAHYTNIIISTKRMFQELEWNKFNRLVLTATYGRMVFNDLGDFFLVVVTDMNIDVDQSLLEIQSAAKKLEKKSQMSG